MFPDFRLAPFWILLVVYFILYKPFYQVPPETITAAVLKAAPIWYLTTYVTLASKDPALRTDSTTRDFAVWTRTGLAVSGFGDMCLVWRDSLFIPGMLFFAVAHGFYINALKRRLNNSERKYSELFLLLGICSYLFVASGIDTWLMAVLVLVYTSLLFWMGYLSIQRHICEHTRASWYGAVGALCFLVSDLAIALNKWKLSLPCAELVIMVTYYAAQYGIALGSTN